MVNGDNEEKGNNSYSCVKHTCTYKLKLTLQTIIGFYAESEHVERSNIFL